MEGVGYFDLKMNCEKFGNIPGRVQEVLQPKFSKEGGHYRDNI